MKTKHLFFFVFIAISLIALAGTPIKTQFTVQTNGTGLLIGRNVNMVSGTDFVDGDPYLQRQNEPSIAVSTRNPMHLLAGANDYRTIDIPFQDELPGIPEGVAARDAWLGVFKSIDGGESWTSTLLPGFPQDITTEGTTSPIYGYDAACDPTVRAGTNGLFFYSGIAFHRADRGAGVVFVARYVDNNNIEDPSTIEYIDTNIIDQGNAGQFIDMPSMAVDIPHGQTSTQTVRTASGFLQDIPCGSVYIAYSVFLGNTVENVRSRILFARSTDCGLTWSNPIKLSESQHIIQRPKIAIDPSDPTGGTIYVTFRRFAHGNNPDAIVIVKSTDGGKTFSKPLEVRPFNPFDQGTSHYSFRTNSYPTITVDNFGIVYLAWSQRVGPLPEEEARIVLTTSSDGGQTWLDPWILDVSGHVGHHFMPSWIFAGGKLMLAWYDQRDDIAIEENPAYFTDFIEDSLCRHTIDVRVAEAEPGPYPVFGPATRVTRYLYLLKTDANGDPIDEDMNGYWDTEQAQFNPPNYPLFQLGTVPFHGDWLEMASLMFLPTQGGGWTYNTDPYQASIFHATWTDNRDVVPPNGDWWGDWTNYTQWPMYNRPDNDFDPDACGNSLNTGMRNQNVYTSAITEGIIVASPGNSKQLDLERTFVVFVKNTTAEEKSFRLLIDEPPGVSASFKQFEDLEELDVTIGPYSTISRTVYVSSANRRASVRIDVVEIDTPGGNPIGMGGLEGYVVLNPDPTNPDALDPNYIPLDYEVHNPRVENPRVENYVLLDELNTYLLNPRVENVDLMNSGYISPRVENPRVENPRVENLNILNPRVENPRVENQSISDNALVDVVWTVANDGNTPSAYTFTLLHEEAVDGDFPGGLIEQILIYKIHTTPAASSINGCDLLEVHHDELVTVISNPRVENPRVENPRVENPRVENPRVENATVNLAPGEEALFVLRIYDEDVSVGPTIEDVIGTEEDLEIGNAMTSHAVDTEDVMAGETTPTVAYSANYTPTIGYSPPSMVFTASEGGSNPAPQTFQIDNTGDGMLSYTITDDAGWLDISPADGIVYSGDPANSHAVSVDITGLTQGTYNTDITIVGYGATNTPQTIPVTLTITPLAPTPGEWVVRHAGVGTSDDFAKDIVADSLGNIYVGGAVDGDLSGGQDTYDFITIKYNTLGNKVWEARYNGPEDKCDDISAMAIDSSGNVYVTGGADGHSATNYNFATVKYDPNGTELWVARFEGPGASYDRPVDIAVDSSGNVYVTGRSTGATGNVDFLTIKYDSAGTEQWQAWYNGPGDGNDEPEAFALDSSGNVVVTGWATGIPGNDSDYATVKYNSITGAQEWAITYDGDGNGPDYPYDIAVDTSGNVYVTGRSDNHPAVGEEYAIATVKYNSSGTFLWDERFIFAGDSAGNAIDLDSSGYVYVTGYTPVGSGTPTDDIVTIKYSPGGILEWSNLYDGPGHGDDTSRDIVVDSTGNAYVTGYSIGNGTVFDYTTIRYSSAGVQEWVRRYDGPSNSELGSPNFMSDLARSMTLDALGHVCVTGYSLGSGTGLDIATIRYRPTLEEWVSRYNGPGNAVDQAQAVVTDSSGNVYVTGWSEGSGTDLDYATIKYNSSGVQQWFARYDGPISDSDQAKALAVDASGNVYVTGYSRGSGTFADYATIKYNSSGVQQWVRRYNGPGNLGDTAHAIAVDSSGNVYVTGYSHGGGTNYDYFTIKYNTNGTQLWTARYDGTGTLSDGAYALAVDASGNVYVTGYSYGLGSFWDYATIKYNSSGVQQWVTRYNGPGNDEDIAYALAVDASGNVYVTGASNGSGTGEDYATIKYSSSGVEEWVRRHNGSGNDTDHATAIGLDASGNVCVTGYSTGSGATYDYTTIMYDSSGVQQWIAMYDGPFYSIDEAHNLVTDAIGNVYVTGRSVGFGSGYDYATIKYDSSGRQIWVMRYHGPDINDDAYSLTVDASGNVYVTGRSVSSGSDYDYATIKYRKEF